MKYNNFKTQRNSLLHIVIFLSLYFILPTNTFATPHVYPWGICRGSTNVNTTFIPYNPAHHVSGKTRSGIFNFDYSANVLPNEKAAIEHAGNIWSSCITSSIPIYVYVDKVSLGSGILAQCAPYSAEKNFGPILNPKYENDVFYPYALADFIKGSDIDPANYDILLNFSNLQTSPYSWYTGTDGNASAIQYDLVTVILHEIMHGLGAITTLSYDINNNNYRHGFEVAGIYYPNRYDKFIKSTLVPFPFLYTLPAPTSASLDAAMSVPCVFDGQEANLANGNISPSLENNNPPYIGVKELKESLYPNEVLGSQTDLGQGMHDIGLISVGILNDLGWNAILPVGLEDNIQILNLPSGNPSIDLITNTTYNYKTQFIDNYPYGDYLLGSNRTWELRLFHKTGSYVINTSSNFDFSFNIGANSLPTGYIWKRNNSGKIIGELVATALDNTNVTHTRKLEILLGYKPDLPEVDMTINGGMHNCANLTISYYGRGATQYDVRYKESGIFGSYIGVLTNSQQNTYSSYGLDETKNYDFEICAENSFGSTCKVVTRTKCTFPIIISPIPSHDYIDIKTIDRLEFIDEYVITDLSTGTRVLEATLNSPSQNIRIDITTLPIGNYIIQVKSTTGLYSSGRLVKNE